MMEFHILCVERVSDFKELFEETFLIRYASYPKKIQVHFSSSIPKNYKEFDLVISDILFSCEVPFIYFTSEDSFINRNPKIYICENKSWSKLLSVLDEILLQKKNL